uniref:Uncharacterized protein n=1 Tax=Amphimedon queenslandica TaxID=400682 RepID=A0A1X7UQ53_AMPQE
LFLIDKEQHLSPLIQAHRLLGTISHSDDFATYRNVVGKHPNVAQHGIVNHLLHFVHPVTNVHT